MKNWSNKIHQCISLLVILGGYVVFYSCKDAEVAPAVIQFDKSFENVSEGEEVMLQVTLDKAAPSEST